MSRIIATTKRLFAFAANGIRKISGQGSLTQQNGVGISQANGIEIGVKTWPN